MTNKYGRSKRSRFSDQSVYLLVHNSEGHFVTLGEEILAFTGVRRDHNL